MAAYWCRQLQRQDLSSEIVQRAAAAGKLLRDHNYLSFSPGLEPLSYPYIEDAVKQSGYSAKDVNSWLQSLEAESVDAAIDALSALDQYPAFVLLFNLNRPCQTRSSILRLIQEYERIFPTTGNAWHFPLTEAAIHLSRKHILEMTVPICRIFVKYAKLNKSHQHQLNLLISRITNFTPFRLWSASDARVLMQAQRALLVEDGPELDKLGVFSLSWLLLSIDPDLATRYVSMPATVETVKGAKDLALVSLGPAYIEVMKAQSMQAAYTTFMEHNLDNSSQPLFVRQRSWSVLLLSLQQSQSLSSDVGQALLDIWSQRGMPPNSMMARQLLRACSSKQQRLAVLDRLPTTLGLEPDLRLGLGYTESKQEWLEMYTAAERFRLEHHELSYEGLLRLLDASATHSPQNCWNIYERILASRPLQPSSWVLQQLCRAAWHSFTRWDTHFASQKAVHECYKYLRGLAPGSQADDPTKLFPTMGTIEAYSVMLGKAQYVDHLRGVQPWLQKLHLKPSKAVQLALIHYLPEGRDLLDLGLKAGTEWPSREEYEVYALEHRHQV